MSYRVEISGNAKKQLKRLDKQLALRITGYLDDVVDGCDNPRTFGKALTADYAGLWRYRIGDYRVICDIIDERCVVTAIRVGHRSVVYRKA